MKLLSIAFILFGAVYAHGQSLSSKSKGNKFNPAIGLNAMTLFQNGTANQAQNGFSIQGVELQFSSDVDAYFRAEATIGMHQEPVGGHEGHEGHDHGAEATDEEASDAHDSHGGGSFHIEPEEVFVETVSLPYVTVKAGKFLVDFGKYNAIHTHAQPFIHRSPVAKMLGHEGLAATGLGLSALAPLPWFSEVSLQGFQPSQKALFADSHDTAAFALKWKNLWAFGDSSTLELGLSGISFDAHAHEGDTEEKTMITGVDATFKWRPVSGGKSTSFMFSTEYINNNREGSVEADVTGLTSFFRLQVAQRWFLQGMYSSMEDANEEEEEGHEGHDHDDADVTYSALVGFVPSEFSSIRVQYDLVPDSHGDDDSKLMVQLNYSIGAHPAHVY